MIINLYIHIRTYIISFAWATANLGKLFCVALCLQHAAEVLTLEPFLHWSLRCSCQLSQRGLVWYGFVKRIWSRWQTNFPLNKKVRSFHRWLSSFGVNPNPALNSKGHKLALMDDCQRLGQQQNGMVGISQLMTSGCFWRKLQIHWGGMRNPLRLGLIKWILYVCLRMFVCVV